MRGISHDIAERIVDAHVDRYPDATPEAVLLKLGEEVGELMRAVNTSTTGTDVVPPASSPRSTKSEPGSSTISSRPTSTTRRSGAA